MTSKRAWRIRHWRAGAKLSPCCSGLLIGIGFFLWAMLPQSAAQTTAFTYQGQLQVHGLPATGNFDLKFTPFNQASGGTPMANTLTNSGISVSNGLFLTQLDFGPAPFSGGNVWMEIAVSVASSNSFTTLSPREQITPAPYATFANTAGNLTGNLSATQVTGAIGAAGLSGTYGNPLNLNNSSNVFAGSFQGNAGGLTNLAAGGIAGTVGVPNGGTGQTNGTPSVANVKAFGAYGDNYHDDTVAIQSAINFCVTNGTPLYLPAGTYLVSGQLNLNNYNNPHQQLLDYWNGFRMYGDAQTATIIHQITTNDTLVFTNLNGVAFTYLHDFSIVGCFNGANAAGRGLVIPTGAGNNNCYFYNLGFYQLSVGAYDYSEDVVWDTCNFQDVIIGLWLPNVGSGNNNYLIRNCTLTAGQCQTVFEASTNFQVGIRIDGGSGHIISGCTMNVYNNGEGMQLQGEGVAQNNYFEALCPCFDIGSHGGLCAWTMVGNSGANRNVAGTNIYPIIAGPNTSLSLQGTVEFAGYSSHGQIKAQTTTLLTGMGNPGCQVVDVYAGTNFQGSYNLSPFPMAWNALPSNPTNANFGNLSSVYAPGGPMSVNLVNTDGNGNYFNDNLDQYNIDSRNGTLALFKSGLTNLTLAGKALESPTTANRMVLPSETGIHFNNLGATGEVDFTLPSGSPGLIYTFDVAAAQTLKIFAGPSATIRQGDSATTVAGGYIQSGGMGSTVTLKAISATNWFFVAHEGTWTVN